MLFLEVLLYLAQKVAGVRLLVGADLTLLRQVVSGSLQHRLKRRRRMIEVCHYNTIRCDAMRYDRLQYFWRANINMLECRAQ